MRPDPSAFPASPLTVWAGSTRYVFAAGRDVTVGYDPVCDISLGNAAPPPGTGPDVVLRFAGTRWVAIDASHNGMFVNGSRVLTVEIRAGQALTIGDPRHGPRLVFELPGPPARPPGPPQLGHPQQAFSQQTTGRMQVPPAEPPRLLVANPVYALFLAFLPVVLAALTLLIPGDSGLDRPGPASHNPHEAIEILGALNISAVIIGTALGIRELVGRRGVSRREQVRSPSEYLATKVVVVSVAAAILTAVMVSIVVAGKGGPVHGAVLLRNATLELYVGVAATAIVSALVGLALSALGNSLGPILLLPVILASQLFNGSLVPLLRNWGLEQVS